jgi:hypothetical protein
MRFLVFVGFGNKLTFVGWLKLELTEENLSNKDILEEKVLSFISAGKKYLCKHLKKENLLEGDIVYVGPATAPEGILAFEYRLRGERAHVFFKKVTPGAYYFTKIFPALAYFL